MGLCTIYLNLRIVIVICNEQVVKYPFKTFLSLTVKLIGHVSQFGGLFVFVQTCKDDHVLSVPYGVRSSIPALFVRLLWRIPVHIWDQNDEILHQLSVCNLHWSFKWHFVHWILYRTERVKNLVLFQEKYVPIY